jgi:eukaryotic-like serine/threonine-protein kinase
VLVPCPSETTLVAHAEGRLPPIEAAVVEAHARTCARCAERLATAREEPGLTTVTVANLGAAQVRPRPLSGSGSGSDAPAVEDTVELERGTSVGRYTVLGLVGKGGMGEVYAAYDPDLDRKIALKLLRARGTDAHSRARLLREAKAIAKLSHANVVVVHDAGTFDDRVFVAMEFIEGQTLKEWLAAAKRSRAAILEVFGAAARGLAAAHAAGLVHRDFKPHNVMVSKDGGVRVMDFGLARQVDAADDDAAAADDEAAALPASPDDLTFTRTGELVGTPLYMAPEQFQATRTDARTDQFSFCVALYQALYRAHPFKGASIDVLVARVLAGEVQPPPPKHDVPTWLRRVVVRGLSVAPAARWPSMAALIEALEHDPARARRRWGVAAGVVLVAGAAAFALVRGPGRAESLCRGGPTRLAGIWEPPVGGARPRRDALAAAFLRAGGAATADTWTRVEGLLDRYAGSWLGMYRDACEATHTRGEQSPETLDLRMDCLDERRAAMGALTTVLANADAAAVAGAVDAVDALPPIDRCGDIRLLREGTDAPRDEATRARISDLRARLATAKALSLTGRYDEATRLGQELVGEARALGNRGLLAQTLATVAWFSIGTHFRPEIVPQLEESAWTAIAVKRDDVAAQSATYLQAAEGYYLGHHEVGRRWARLATALIERMGPGHDLLRAWLMTDEALMRGEENDDQGSLELLKHALELKQRALPPDHPDVALGLDDIAETYHRLGREDEALRLNARALDLLTRAYGPSAPEVARVRDNGAEYLLAVGRAKEALAAAEEAYAHWSTPNEPESPTVGFPLTSIGQALLALGRPAAALPPLEHALRLREAAAPDARTLAETRFALARALEAAGGAGARPRARALATQARDGYARLGAGASKDDRASDRTRAQARDIDAWLARP